MSELAVRSNGADVIEAVITKGDLAKLSPAEKTRYYAEVCRSVGLNPFTRPFEYISLSGKLTLYARREATDQLRKLNGISLEILSREVIGDILTVHVKATDKTGRTDEDYGSVSIKGLAGEALANQTMKGITKAKRRVTLSISGLGFLDESELEGIPAHERAAPVDTRAQLDDFAGERRPDVGEAFDRAARDAAARGSDALRAHLRGLGRQERDLLRDAIGTAEQPGELLLLAQRADTEHPAGIPSSAAPHMADAVAPAWVAAVMSYDPDTGEVIETAKPDPVWAAEFLALVPKAGDDDRTDWATYAQAVAYLISQAGKTDLAGLEVTRHPHLRRLREEDIDQYRAVTAAIAARAKELAAGAA